MIDTLKLARRLEAAKLPKEQAEALAEGLNEGVGDELIQRMNRIERDVAVLKWMVGANLALTAAILGHLLFIH